MIQTENINLPILQEGDKYSKDIQNQAFRDIDREIKGLNDRVKILDNVEGSIIETKEDVEALKINKADTITTNNKFEQTNQQINKINEQLEHIENNDIKRIDSELESLKQSTSSISSIEQKVNVQFPSEISELNRSITSLTNDYATINKKVSTINSDLSSKGAEISTLKTNVNQNTSNITSITNKVDYIAPDNIVYFDLFGELIDCSKKLQEIVDSGNNIEIRFSNKEYVFKTKVKISRKVRLIGSNTSFTWKGNGRFLEFLDAPWLIEGCLIKDITFKGRGQNVGSDIMIYSETPNVMMTIERCQFYNCYCHLRFHTQSFGHRIVDCSFWGFTNAINCTGNAEQITIDHCWFDDGYRGDGTTNACIRVEDATSFWIVRCVLQNADIGVSFRGVRNGTIRDCHFENMIDASIWFVPVSQYENRNCVIDCNFIVGGKRGIYFYKSSQKNVHNTISNNYFAYLGDSATHHIIGNASSACEYAIFYGNSVASAYTGKPLLNSNVETNKVTSFQ